MATVKYGASISDARGSVGGTVMSRNLAGAYTRARVAPVNRNTPKQSLVRQNFGANSKMWSGTLTGDQRSAWTLFAQANPVPNRLGDSIILSGLAMFLGLNQTLSQIGAAPILDAPADLSVTPLATVTGVTMSASGDMDVNTDAQALITGSKYLIQATGSLAAGRTPPSSAYRFMQASPAVVAATTVEFDAAWIATYGAAQVGGSVGVKVSTVNTSTGATTPAQVFWATFAT